MEEPHVSKTEHPVTEKRYIHCAVGSGKRPTSERLAVMVEEEAVDSETHFVSQAVVLFRLRLGLGDPVLHLRFSNDTVAVQLVSASDQRVERLLGMMGQKIHPYWIISALESRPTEVVRVHTRTKAIALIKTCHASAISHHRYVLRYLLISLPNSFFYYDL